MALGDVVATVVARWGEILPYLEPEDLQAIADGIRRVDSAADQALASNALAADLVTLMVVRLPAGHPVRAAAMSLTRFAGPAAENVTVVPDLRALPGIATALSSAAGPAGSGRQVSGREVTVRLLAAPAFTPDEIREAGGDPDRDDLVRLTEPAGGLRLPSFQFGAQGGPLPVVSAVNLLLHASEDPWGAADWWLGANGWLGAVPAELIGRVDDLLLTEAAAAEASDR